MQLRSEDKVSLKEYRNDLKRHNYLTLDTGFLDKLDREHVMDIFRDVLEKNKLLVKFEELERNKYQYRPKKLANNLYGSPDIYFVIMKMNGFNHPSDMDLKDPIYLMQEGQVQRLLAVIEELSNKL